MSDRKERFAKLLAQGCTVMQIREIMGLTNGVAQRIMCTIRKEVGCQAR